MALLHVQQLPGVLIGMCPPDLEAPRLLDPSNLVHLPPPPGVRIALPGDCVKFWARLKIGFHFWARRPACAPIHWWAEAGCGSTITTSTTLLRIAIPLQHLLRSVS